MNEFEVYIHVPFCLRRCGYCDFNTYTAADLGGGASRAAFADKLIAEMQLVRAWQEQQGCTIKPASTVFFGGGTPTILPATDLGRMLAAVRQVWGLGPGAEVTTEANPDTVDEDYIGQLADLGFNRISLGMQSAVPQVLATLDRTHNQANVSRAVRAARAAGLRISVDLIYGTPGESLDDWRASLEAALVLGTNHISAYALSLEPTTKMGRLVAAGKLAAPDPDDEAGKYELADQAFSQAGLDWYEISNWARDGEVSQHNLGYWTGADWAGLGPGAHSHFTGAGAAGENPFNRRAWDVKHPRLWAQQLDQDQIPWAGSELIGQSEALEELVMLGLRLRQGLDSRSLPRPIPQPVLGQLVDDGLLDVIDRPGSIGQPGSASPSSTGPAGRRLVPTLRGRLLNDLLIERVLEAVGA